MTKTRVITIIIIVMVSTVLFSDPPDWEVITGTQYSMVVMAEISLCNQPFEGIGTNMAGAFGPGGETDCRSVGAWQDANPPYWDGYWYFTIVGNTNGEIIGFKIYDEATDIIYDCNVTVTFEDNATIGLPTDLVKLSAVTCSAPENLIISTTSDSVFIEWDAVPGASSYTMYSSDNPYSSFPENWNLIETGIVTTSWSYPLSGDKKFFRVTANN